MIGYVTIGAKDVEGALPFYDAVFGAIGGERKSFDNGWAFYGPKGGEGNVGICKPFDGQAARAGNGVMIAFKAETQDQVRAAHAAALAAGGSRARLRPRRRRRGPPRGRPGPRPVTAP